MPVNDLAIHPRDSDLVIATHRRGVYIIDDLEIMRQITPEVLGQNVYLFQPAKVIQRNLTGDIRNVHGGEFIGENPQEVGKIFYYLKRRPLFGAIRVEIYDAGGKRLKTIPGSNQRGLNSVEWFLRLKPPKPPKIKSFALLDIPSLGPLAPEGTYSVKLVMGKESWETRIELTYPDDYAHSAESRKIKEKTIWKLYDLQNKLGYVDFAATRIKEKASVLIGDKKLKGSLRKSLKQLITELEAMRNSIIVDRDIQGFSIDQKLRERIVWHYLMVDLYPGKPSQTQLDRTEKMAGEVRAAETRFHRIKNRWLDPVNRELEKANLNIIEIPGEEEFLKTQ